MLILINGWVSEVMVVLNLDLLQEDVNYDWECYKGVMKTSTISIVLCQLGYGVSNLWVQNWLGFIKKE